MWRVVGIPRTCSFSACSRLVKVERKVSLCCHQEEILNYNHNTICNMISSVCKLENTEALSQHTMIFGPQQRFYFKNSNRTTRNASVPFQFLSRSWLPTFYPMRTRWWLFYWWTDVIFFDDGAFSDSKGTFTSTAVSEHMRILWNRQSQFFSRLLEDKVCC